MMEREIHIYLRPENSIDLVAWFASWRDHRSFFIAFLGKEKRGLDLV